MIMDYTFILMIVVTTTKMSGCIAAEKDYPDLEKMTSPLAGSIKSKFDDGTLKYGSLQQCTEMLQNVQKENYTIMRRSYHEICGTEDEILTDISASTVICASTTIICGYLMTTIFDRSTDIAGISVWIYDNQFHDKKTFLGISTSGKTQTEISFLSLKPKDGYETSYCTMRSNHKTAFNLACMCMSDADAESSHFTVIKLIKCHKVEEDKDYTFLGSHFSYDLPNSAMDIKRLQMKDCSKENKELCNEDVVEVSKEVYQITYNEGGKKGLTNALEINYLSNNPPREINSYFCSHAGLNYKHKTYVPNDNRNKNCSAGMYKLEDLQNCKLGLCSGDDVFCKNFGCSSMKDYLCKADECSKQFYLHTNRRLQSFIGIDKLTKTVKARVIKKGTEMAVGGEKTDMKCENTNFIINARGPLISILKICKLPYCLEMKPNATLVKLQLLRPMLLTNGIITARILYEGNTKMITLNTYCSKVDICEFSFQYFSWSKWQVMSCYTPLQWLLVSFIFILIVIFGKHIVLITYWFLSITIIYSWPFMLYGYLMVKKFILYLNFKLSNCKSHIDNEVKITKSQQRYANAKDVKLDFKINLQKVKRARVLPSWMDPKHRTISNHGSNSTSLIVVFCFISIIFDYSTACSKVASITVENNLCEMSETGTQTCTLTSSSRIALSPVGQISCFLLEDPTGKPLGSVQIKTDNIKLSCKKNSLYFIPKAESQCQSSYSCWLTGWCSSDYIECNHPEDYTDDIFGKTRGKFWHRCKQTSASSDCLWTTTACVHTLVKLDPSGQVGYEVFNCLEWAYSAKVTITFIQNMDQQVDEINLTPGQISDVVGMQAFLISVSTPPSVTFDKCFMKKGNLITVVDCNKRGEYAVGRIGEIQCPTLKESESDLTNCIADEDLVKLVFKNQYVSCEDKILDPETYFKTSVLPTKIGDYQIDMDDDRIPYAKISEESLLEIQIDMHGKKLVSSSDKNLCYASFKSLTGCYSCMIGAELTIEVNTNFGSATALINCPEINFISSTSVNSKPELRNISLLSTKSHIEAECTIKCPAGEKKFQISGDLYYVPNDDHHSNHTETGTSHDKSGVDWSGLLKLPGFNIVFPFVVSIIVMILIIILIKIGLGIYFSTKVKSI